MTEKRFRVFKIDDMYGVSDDVTQYTVAWDKSKLIMENLCVLLNEQDEIIRSYEEIFRDIIQIRDIEISDHIRFRVCSIVDAKTYGRIKEALKR